MTSQSSFHIYNFSSSPPAGIGFVPEGVSGLTSGNLTNISIWVLASVPLGTYHWVASVDNLQRVGHLVDITLTVADKVDPLPFPSHFDYRNWHGENWMTPVKDQGSCGSCWAFAATGSTEALANLYFNRHLDLDLSEQDVLSCSGAGNCQDGGYADRSFDYYINTGVASETCFPYDGTDALCNKCSNWNNEAVKISGKEQFPNDLSGENWFKEKLLTKGVLTSVIHSWWHIMPMVGWETDSDGSTVWIFKNSWGSDWGDNGYGKLKLPLSDIDSTYALLTPVVINGNQPSVACVDKDRDGYYNWGIGSKPPTCPTGSRLEKDCDDSNPSLGTYDNNYNCLSIVSSPSPAPSCTVCNADIDKSNTVDNTDYNRLKDCFGKFAADTDLNGNSCEAADINKDSKVNLTDFNCLKIQLNKSCQQ